jgi:molybdate transport system substrate-binding protein
MNRRSSATTITALVVSFGAVACSSNKAASPSAAGSGPAASSAAASSPDVSSPDVSSPDVSSPDVSGTVVVFAAASLKGTFTTLVAAFERANPGVKVVPSYGGSDTLAAQITQGAPVDVFAAASTTTMATVTKAGAASGTPQVFAKNELEIAVPPTNPNHVTALADVTRSGVKLALCAPTVPCGAAATKAFAAAKLTSHPATLEQDVTAVLTKVELGEVDAGLVYQTDVKSAGSKVSGVNFAEATSAINAYPITVIKGARNPSAAQAFVAYVLSAAGQQVLRAAGFQQP